MMIWKYRYDQVGTKGRTQIDFEQSTVVKSILKKERQGRESERQGEREGESGGSRAMK